MFTKVETLKFNQKKKKTEENSNVEFNIIQY